jgi:hypothetical protein
MDPVSKSVADRQGRVILASIRAVEYRTRMYSLLKHNAVHCTVHAADDWATRFLHVQFRPGIGDLTVTESFRSCINFLQVNWGTATTMEPRLLPFSFCPINIDASPSYRQHR